MGQIEQMKIFVRVVESGSISEAARQLNMTKSMVSRQLSELEKNLGIVLAKRTTRRITLTDVGRHYYQQSLGIIDEVERLNQQTRQDGSQIAGPLHLAAPVSFGTLHLSAAVNDFMKKYPNIQLHLSLSDSQHHLVEEGIDVALRIAQLQDSSLKARYLTPIRFMLVASQDYLNQHGPIDSPEDLVGKDILHYSFQKSTRWHLYQAEHCETVDYQAVLSADNGEILRDLAIAGQGVTMLPTFICWQAIVTGQLVNILSDYQPASLDAWLVYPNMRYQSRRARVFMDFLLERFSNNPYWDQALSHPS